MSHLHRYFAAALVAAVALAPLVAAAQQTAEPPRTSWGDPALGGVWDFRTITPLERPEEYGDREFLTEEEAAALEEGAVQRDITRNAAPAQRTEAGGNVGAYNWFWLDFGTKVVAERRTSLIVDPPTGRRPPPTPEAEEGRRAWAARGPTPPASVEQLSLFDRCIGTAALPIYPTAYNNYVQIFQTPDHVALIVEMMGSTRIIPLDAQPHAGIRQGLGSSRGHWQGDTLVVETTGFDNRLMLIGASRDTRRLLERFTRVGPGAIRYEFTVYDPSVWTSPWTAVQTLRATDAPIFEFACHEGNYAATNILAGARKAEAQNER